MAADFVQQPAITDAQQLGGPLAIPSGALQRVADGVHLSYVPEAAQSKFLRRQNILGRLVRAMPRSPRQILLYASITARFGCDFAHMKPHLHARKRAHAPLQARILYLD